MVGWELGTNKPVVAGPSKEYFCEFLSFPFIFLNFRLSRCESHTLSPEIIFGNNNDVLVLLCVVVCLVMPFHEAARECVLSLRPKE